MTTAGISARILSPSAIAESRFWSKVDRTATCWFWNGCIDKQGYGVCGFERRTQFAHRVSYQLTRGAIPVGLTIDHLCRTTGCVRPDHLEVVTLRENIRRAYVPKTHCPKGHELTPDNMIRHGRSNRVCRTCRRAYEKTKKARKSDAARAGGFNAGAFRR